MGKRIAFIVVICILVTMVSSILTNSSYFFGFDSLLDLFSEAPAVNIRPILDTFYEFDTGILANIPIIGGAIRFLSNTAQVIVTLFSALLQCLIYLLYLVGSIFAVA